jgi:predicted outer membrane repeat protein
MFEDPAMGARSHHSIAIVIILAYCGACSPAAAFIVYKVDPTCGAPGAFSTIQEAVDAAAANTGVDYVWISHDGHTTTYSEHVVVNDPDGVIIEGGFNDCYDFDPGTDQTSVGASGSDPVFDIVGTGHNVYLGGLFISGAQRGDGDSGGGINFAGYGELDIANTTVFNNHAGYGGGINVTASGGQATLYLLHDTTIYLNEAFHSGGGIRLEGDSRLFVTDVRVAINGNTAATYGGGIEILGPARADIGSAGGGFGDGVVAANYAANGGGIAVLDNGNGEAILRVFADGSHQPSSIVENRATTNGGAIYLAGLADACLFSPHLGNNIAEDGAAISYTYLVADGSDNYATDGGIYINAPPARLPNECGPETIAALGGTKDCFTDQCNSITGHATRHADNTLSSGSAITKVGNDFFAARLRIQGNIGGRVIDALNGTTGMSRCLITDNSASGELIFSSGYPNDYDSCTIANNSIGSAYIFNIEDGIMHLTHDILDQPGKNVVTRILGIWDVNYTMAADAAQLPTGTNPGDIQGTPTFVDAAHSDYHLRANSLGVDFAPFVGGIDLDGALGDVDLPQIPNKFGPTEYADLGAYELQTAFACDNHADAVFCNGFDL